MFLAEPSTPVAITTADVFNVLTEIMGVIWGVFADCASTIMDNPLLFVPVLIALAATVIMFAIGVVRRLGVKGVSSAGGRRRRRGR